MHPLLGDSSPKSFLPRASDFLGSEHSAYPETSMDIFEVPRHSSPAKVPEMELLRQISEYTQPYDDVIALLHENHAQPSETPGYQQSFSSPIYVLPTEIMTEILLMVLAGEEFHFYDLDLHCVCEVYILMGVCSWWRELILSHPIFWTLPIDFFWGSGADSSDTEAVRDALKACLSRSGSTLPLKISVRFFDAPSPSQLGLSECLLALAEHKSQWQELTVNVYECRAFEYLFTSVNSGNLGLETEFLFPLLEKLEIGICSRVSSLRPSLLSKIVVNSPRLRTLYLPRSFEATSTFRKSEFKNLTSLTLECYFGRSFGCLLEACPLLQDLDVRDFVPGSDHQELPSIYHTHLRTLTIGRIDPRSTPNVWQSVRLPNLTSLKVAIDYRTLHFSYGDICNRLNDLRRMILLSKCVLQELHFDHLHWISQIDVVAFLEGIPTKSCIVDGLPFERAD
ncbi:hypothetical protein GYMLUDRAFT_85984 [Collybiopsis luxurians FD-317 M1]|uniref:F-box domain-containing protein n=1 Tax=Collybiopsis luxurians FD-317 M1 TaxID=944289 RepID=A0A0D0BV20_9AGAR|nr:hypothetical protein GYMLUDRAFT_85984 [Collybiopsis luxurians FD-317 M1]